jgi:NAD(P)-dependent dehydrogenase (short-subunit alcohol dehydrogenase family)
MSPWTAADVPDQTGKVAVVTGGNGGLGQETVRELARRGAHVVIGARNPVKAEAARSDVVASVPSASLEVHRLDLASLRSIREFATTVLDSHSRVDLLFNNAGVMGTTEGSTEDGFETQFGTNHLGHFALTALLLPAMVRSPAARVVCTTSTARFFAGDYDLSNPHLRGAYRPWVAYGISKRANLQFALELDRRLRAAGSPARALAADPGYSNTDLQAAAARNNAGRSQRFFHAWVVRVGQPAAMGALPQLRAGTDPAANGGTLYRPRWLTAGPPVVGAVSRRLRPPDQLARLWAVSEADTGIRFDVAGIVAEA